MTQENKPEAPGKEKQISEATGKEKQISEAPGKEEQVSEPTAGESRTPGSIQKTAFRQVTEMLTLISQLAITMVVPIAGCMYIGYLIDKKTGFGYASVIGFVIGAVAGYRSVYSLVKKYIKKK